MDDVSNQRHRSGANDEGNLEGTRPDEGASNARQDSPSTDGVDRSQFAQSRLDTRDIKQPTVATACLVVQAVRPRFGQH